MKLVNMTLCCCIVLLTACTTAQRAANEATVAVTFFPLQEVTQRVVGNTAKVYSIVPAGVEPHDYEPAPNDIAMFQQAQTFVTLGLEFSHIEAALLASRDEAPYVINAAQGLSLLAVSGDAAHETDEHADDEAEHYDPHVWLSIPNMVAMTRTVEAQLAKQKPDAAAVYAQNANAYIVALEQLHARYKTELAQCEARTLLVNHQAFGYLANEYDLEQIPISGISPDAEPTPGDLAALIDVAKAHNVHVVFTEELVDSRIAQTIADEVGAKTLLLSPAEGTRIAGDSYIAIMERNLNNLKVGLRCQ